jgi:phage tail-like protein
MSHEENVSTYLNYLPAIFHDDPFLGKFLLAFETVLSQAPPDHPAALETLIAQSHIYLKPLVSGGDNGRAPQSFLPWLAGWVALTLREDWDEEVQRKFIREVVTLYRQRGTKAGLTRLLQIYLGDRTPVTIYDDDTDFGFDPPAHFFQVEITVNDRDPVALRRKQQIAQAIIEQEKPAHTFYALQMLVPTMRLLSEELAAQLGGERLILGVNTLLGTRNTRS